MPDRERATHFRKPQIVTDRQSNIELIDLATGRVRPKGGLAADKLIAGRKTGTLVQRSRRYEMGLTIFGDDFAGGIDKHLRVVNGFRSEERRVGREERCMGV